MAAETEETMIAGAATSKELRALLFKEIKDVQGGKVSLHHGNTVARLGAQIINSVFADIAASRNYAAMEDRNTRLIGHHEEANQD